MEISNSKSLITFVLVIAMAPSILEGAARTETEEKIPPAPIIRSNIDELEALLMSAYLLYTQKKYDEALAKCAKAAEMRPSDNRPYAISGLVYMAQWKMKSASESLAKAISFSPRNEKLHYMKARADRFRNAKAESLASVRKAIELNPSYAEAYLLLGQVLGIGEGDDTAEIAAFRKAIEFDPKLLDAYRELGMVLKVNKDEKGAEETYRKAMEIDAKKTACRFELGRLLVEQGRLKEARALWEERTTDKDDTFPNFITLLERAEKMEKVKAALAEKPNDPDTLLKMGLMVMDGESWVVDGRQERAIEYFRKALAIRPDFAEAQHGIVKAYIEIADFQKDKSKIIDEELAKLKKLDVRLFDQAVEYRKKYRGAITGTPVEANQ